MKFTSILALAIVAVLMLTMFVACKPSDNDNSKAPESSAPVTDNSEAVSEVSEAPKGLVPHLDKNAAGLEDLDGFEIGILTAETQDYSVSQLIGYIDEDDETDPILTAVAERNAKLEAEYGFTIKEYIGGKYGEFMTTVRSDAESGLHDYQVLSTGAYYIAPLSTEGYCRDLYSLENSYLSLDQKWWDPTTQVDMTVAHSLYFANGDITIVDDQSTYGIFFNKDLAEQYNLGDLYQLVRDGEWTYDKMYEMIKTVAHPVGDGTMDVTTGTDVWGMVGVYFDTYQLILGGGIAQIQKTDEDLPEFAMNKEQNINNYLSVYEIMADMQRVALVEDYYSWNDERGKDVTGHFTNGNALFRCNTIFSVDDDSMKNADFHYGILPMPKYNKEQTDYACTITPYHFNVIAICSHVEEKDIPEVTFCLEAMSYLASQTVTPAFYDVTLKNKRFVDDDDSEEMLDLLFRNRIVDQSIMFNWDDCIQYYNRMLKSKTVDVVSFCEGEEESFNAAMQETIDIYLNMMK